MNWPLLLLAVLALVAFVVARRKAREWIVNRWLEDRITNHQAAALFVLVLMAPLVLITAWVLITNISSSLVLLIPMLILVWVAVAAGGLLDYASQHGVKERIRRDRELRGEPPGAPSSSRLTR